MILKSGNMGLLCTFSVRYERFHEFYFQHRLSIFIYPKLDKKELSQLTKGQSNKNKIFFAKPQL